MTAAQIVQVIIMVSRLVGQPADLMVELARAESGLNAQALCDQAAVQGADLSWGEAVKSGASGGLYCFQWGTAQWAAERVGLEIAPEDLSDPWVNTFLAAKLLDWGYGGYFHAMERLPAAVRPAPDDPMFRNAPMWETGE